MALVDRMRIVEQDGFNFRPVIDLMDGVNYTHLRGQFSTNRPQKNRTTVSGQTRWDGDRVTYERAGNGTIVVQWFVGGSSNDDAMRRTEILGSYLENATAQGRLIEVRYAGTTKSVFYEPRGTADWNIQGYDPIVFGSRGVLQVTATINVAPTAAGAPMDIEEHFSYDSISDGEWIKDGAAALQVIGTQAAPNGLGTARYRHARGYAYQDMEIRATFVMGTTTVTSGRWGIFLSADQTGVDTKLALEIDKATNQFHLATYVAGVRTVIQTAALTITLGLTYQIRVIRNGDTLRVFCGAIQTTAGQPLSLQLSDFSTTYYTQTWTLTASQLRFQGGDVGIQVTSVDATERIDDFIVRPYSYYGVATPERIPLLGRIPGTAPAKVDIEFTTNDASAIGNPPIWALQSWTERPLATNLCHAGDFESSAAGWSHAVLTNFITVAATSHTQDTTTSRYGAGELTVVTPASAQSGVSFNIYQRMKANRQYAAWCWARSAAGTTALVAKLGQAYAGGTTIGTAKALTTGWQLYAVTHRPSADSDGLAFAITTNAATATTFSIDGVVVVEVPTITLAAAISSTSATSLQVYFTPPDTPYLNPDGTISQPFLFLIDSELIRCTAIAPATNTWTIERGAEYTVAATHAVDASVILAPQMQPHLEGKGAEPMFGIIEGENHGQDISSVVSGPASYNISLGDPGVRSQGIVIFAATGAATGILYYYLDPSLLTSDDFTLGEMDVEVFVRLSAAPGIAATILGYVEPTEKIGSGLVLAGKRRYSREFGAVAKSIILPASAAQERLTKLGTFPVVVDRTNPQRWRLAIRISVAATSNMYIDYLLVNPIRYRACLPTGKQDDGGVTYPNVIPPDPNWGAANYAMTKIFRSDGSALIRNPIPDTGRVFTLPPAFPDHGYGKPIAFPPGAVDVMFKLSDSIPDDPTINNAGDMSHSTNPSWICTLRHMVTPQYFVGRGGY